MTSKTKLLELASLIGIIAALGLLGGCDNDGPVEDAAEAVDEAVEEVADEIDDAT